MLFRNIDNMSEFSVKISMSCFCLFLINLFSGLLTEIPAESLVLLSISSFYSQCRIVPISLKIFVKKRLNYSILS